MYDVSMCVYDRPDYFLVSITVYAKGTYDGDLERRFELQAHMPKTPALELCESAEETADLVIPAMADLWTREFTCKHTDKSACMVSSIDRSKDQRVARTIPLF
jgi:hypothetical protein